MNPIRHDTQSRPRRLPNSGARRGAENFLRLRAKKRPLATLAEPRDA